MDEMNDELQGMGQGNPDDKPLTPDELEALKGGQDARV